MSYDSEELDSVIDEHRERMALEREALIFGDFAKYYVPDQACEEPCLEPHLMHVRDHMTVEGPRNNLCEICLIECDGGVCVRCESYGGLYDDWRSDCDG